MVWLYWLIYIAGLRSDHGLGMDIHPTNGYSSEQKSGSTLESESEFMQWNSYCTVQSNHQFGVRIQVGN